MKDQVGEQLKARNSMWIIGSTARLAYMPNGLYTCLYTTPNGLYLHRDSATADALDSSHVHCRKYSIKTAG